MAEKSLRLPLSVLLGLRLGGSRSGFLLPVISLALGIALLTATLAVMRGFEDALRERVLGLIPQVTLRSSDPVDWDYWRQRLLEEEDVIGAAPLSAHSALLHAGGRTAQVLLAGIDPELERQVSVLGSFLPPGMPESLREGQLIIGATLARRLQLDVGQGLRVILPVHTSTGLRPKFTKLNVAAIFDSGTEVDRQLALVHLRQAGILLGDPDLVSGLRLKLKKPLQAAAVAEQLGRKYPHWQLIDWTDTHGNIYHSLLLSRRILALLLLAIVFVASFNVAASLAITTGERRGEIAMLRSIGAGRSLILRAVLLRGLWVGCCGTSLGLAVGGLVAQLLDPALRTVEGWLGSRLLSEDVYFLSYVPVRVALADIGFVSLAALTLCTLVALYPAWRAAGVSPVDVLRWQ